MTFSEGLLKRLNEIWNGKIQCIIDAWMTLLKDFVVEAIYMISKVNIIDVICLNSIY